MSTPAVSVMMPVYNSAHRVAAAIGSVLAQTFTDLELIVVDDGSTDGLAPVLASFGDRIVTAHQPNRGVAAARNTALSLARGRFLAWLDADDIWLARKLERQMPLFSNPEVGLVFADYETRYADGRVRPSFLTNHPHAAQGHIYDNYVQSRFFLPSTVVIRRECLDRIGLFEEHLRRSEDVALFARILLRWQAAMVPEVLAVRSEGDHNLTAASLQTRLDTIQALQLIQEREQELSPSNRRALASELGRLHWWMGYDAFHEDSMGTARTYLSAALRYGCGAETANCKRLLYATWLPHIARRALGALRK